MVYKFILNNEIIRGRPGLTLYTGNSSTYRFEFSFDKAWNGLQKFITFSDGENTYVSPLTENCAAVPSELLNAPGSFFFGIYATAADNEIKRMSSNIVNVTVLQGAYSKGTKPSEPTKDVWENLVSKSVPIIGDTGNWMIWDFAENEYVDTGKPSSPLYDDSVLKGKITRLETQTEKKADKVNRIISSEKKASIVLADNTEFVFTSDIDELSIEFDYSADSFITSVVFNSGETPPDVVLPAKPIYYIGTDSGGYNIFTPAANKHYTMIFTYDSDQPICYVSATPAHQVILFSMNNNSDEGLCDNDGVLSENAANGVI